MCTYDTFKKDCDKIDKTNRRIYLADGSSVICTQSGSIDIPIIKNNKNLGTLILDDVLIVPHLDRRLFSVNSFLSKGNNWVHFEKNHIELGISDGPKIRLPLSSLQSNAFVVESENEYNNNSQNKKLKLSTNTLHD